jgi:methionine synthase II (cobalamin-independent)
MRYKQGRAYTKEAYANDAEYFKDVAKVYQAELDMLYKAGLRNVQFDDPGLACKWRSPSTRLDSSPVTNQGTC